MTIDFSVPLNTVFLLTLAYYLQKTVFPSSPSSSPSPASVTASSIPSEPKSYTWMPKTHPPVLVYKKYTPKTLVQFDGRGGERILLAIAGKVFDVSAGRNFYGPDGPYGNFAGRDASRGMAKQSFEEDVLTPIDQPLDKLDDLTPSEIENMKGWSEHFTSKYIVCGELVENTDTD